MSILPFTRTQFLEVFAAYNTAIWPAQIIAVLLAVMSLVLIWLRVRFASQFSLGVLAILWAWTGGMYHIAHFAAINSAAVVFGIAFLAQAVLLIGYAITDGVSIARGSNSKWLATILITYALLLYPLLVWAGGHAYPATPTFGVTPCPLVIFTFGLLSLTTVRAPWVLFVIPVLWSVVGGSAPVLLGMHADFALPLSAIAAIVSNAAKPIHAASNIQ